jgi:hypothetical protein
MFSSENSKCLITKANFMLIVCFCKIYSRVVISQAFINITKVKYSNMVEIQDVPRTYPENEHV